MDKKTKKKITALNEKLAFCRMRLSGMKRQPDTGDNPEALMREIAEIEDAITKLKEQ